MLRIPNGLLLRILAHCRGGYPEERCGGLVGRVEGGERVVQDVRPLTNVNRERARDRYEVDPLELLALDRSARETQASIVGFYHSHPDHPERPSAADTERAWAEYSYLIVSIRGGQAAGWRSWRLVDGSFVEEGIATDPPPGA